MIKTTLCGLALLAGLTFSAQAQTYTPPKKPQNLKELQDTTVTKNTKQYKLSEGILTEQARLRFRESAEPCQVTPGGLDVLMLPGGLALTCRGIGRTLTMYLPAAGNGLVTPDSVISLLDSFGPDSTRSNVGIQAFGTKPSPAVCPNWMKLYFWPGDDSQCYELKVLHAYEKK